MNAIEIGPDSKSLEENPHHIAVDMYGSPEVRADIRSLPFKELDRIFASHVLEHIPDAHIVIALKSIRSCLKEDGEFEMYVPDLTWFMRKFLHSSGGERWSLWNMFIFGSQEGEGQYHKTGFSVKRLSDCLVAAGFRKIEVRRTKERKKGYGMHAQGIFYLMEVHAVAYA